MQLSTIYLVLYLLQSVEMFEVTHSSHKTSNITCPTACKCSRPERRATCSSTFSKKHHPLTYVPSLPSFVNSLTLTGCDIANITKEKLHNLTSITLKSLIIQETKTKSITPDAFEELQDLVHVEINRNIYVTPEIVSLCVSSLNKSSITKIRFQYNKWKNLPQNIFHGLAGSNITTITLKGNRIQNLDCSMFSGLKKLKDISISSNEYLTTVNIRGLPESLRSLDLSDNSIIEFPNFCLENFKISPFLYNLNLQNNHIKTVPTTSLSCLKKLAKLNLNLNNLQRLTNNTFRNLVSLQTLLLSNACKGIPTIEPLAFKSSSLSRLSFDANNFRFDRTKNYNPDTIFSSCPNLTFLTLEKNTLPSRSSLFRRMFLPLRKLKKLILQSVTLRQLPANVFPRMRSLRELSLSGNLISGWNDNPNIFGNITWLDKLILHGNKIRTINKTSFPAKMLSTLKYLDLATNEFACACDLMWFRDWIRKNKTLVLENWPKRYFCRSPPTMNGILLEKYNPTAEICRVPNPVITVAIILSVVCGAAVIIIVVLYKSRWHIRYGIYLLRAKRKGYDSIPSGNFAYDSFVVYSEDDREWVHDKLVSKLEQENNFHLCVHYRDFKVGNLIVDNIIDSINQSKKVIVVLSNSFARSEWCQFELKVSHKRFLNTDSNMLVLVMLEEIDNKHLSSFLRTLITTTTYAVWTEEDVGQSQFWDQLITALAQ